MSTVRDRERGRQAGVCCVSEMKWTPMQFASMVNPLSLIHDAGDRAIVEELMRQDAITKERWVTQQLAEGCDVVEFIIDTGKLRMRPLRPKDV